MNIFRLSIFLGLVLISFFSGAQSTTNKFRVFFGVGNNNPVSDMISLTDKSFLGEVSGQVRCGIRIYDNYEINFGAYMRAFPEIDKYPGVTYNKFLGYSGSLMYEHRNADSRWGIPFGFEVLKYNRNIDSAFNDGSGKVYFDHYDAFSYGPKIGVRYHFSNYFFLETELELLYEHFIQDLDWHDKVKIDANSFSSFKFFGVSANLSF